MSELELNRMELHSASGLVEMNLSFIELNSSVEGQKGINAGKDVRLRIRTGLSPYKVYGNSTKFWFSTEHC